MKLPFFHIIRENLRAENGPGEPKKHTSLKVVLSIILFAALLNVILHGILHREIPCLLCSSGIVLVAFLALTCLLNHKLNCVFNTLFTLPLFIYAFYISDFNDHAPLAETIYHSLWWLLGGMLFLFYFSDSDAKIILYSLLSVFTLGFHLLKANLFPDLFYGGLLITHPVVMYILIFSGVFLIRHRYKNRLSALAEKYRTTQQGISKVIQNSRFSVAQINAERDEEGNVLKLWIENVNNAFEAAFKIQLHEVKNQEAHYIFDLIFPGDHFDINKFLLFNKQKTREFHAHKKEKWYKIHVLKPDYNKFFLIFEDITKARKKTADLENSRKRYKVLLEAIPDMFFVIGKDGTYEDFVIKESDVFKMDDVNIVGNTIYDVGFPENMAEKIASCIQNSLRNNTIETIEYSLNTPNGTYLYEMRLAKLTARSVISVARDITRRKNAEFSLEKAKKRAEESDRLKSAFLANLSHEIRTPLNIITNFTRMLTDSELEPPEKTELADAISQNGNQLLNMIDNTIHLSKIETDEVRVENNFCKVNDLMRDIYNQCSPLLPDSRPVKLNLHTDVPNPAFGFKTDRRLLREVLLILVDNAIKYTFKGAITFEYQMLRNEAIKFTVTDTGIGIPDSEKEHIFSRFYRIRNEINDQTSGSGIGLSIAQHYVRLLGGDLQLESAPGQGSAFWFSLPFLEGEGYLKVVS